MSASLFTIMNHIAEVTQLEDVNKRHHDDLDAYQ